MSVTITGLKLPNDGSDAAAPGQLSWTGPLQQNWLDMGPKELSQTVCDFVQRQGLAKPAGIALVYKKEAILRVASANEPSSYDATSPRGLLIRPDETMASWWTTFNKRHGAHKAAPVIVDSSGLNVNGTRIELHRTLRVPDDGKAHKLPPSLGTFPLESVSKYASTLPESIVARGGYITPIYNREALWISLPGYRDSAIKVSVGSVNAITGLDKSTVQTPQSAIQDYLAPSQPWLDGIAKKPGVVGQFVAMPVNEGYTIEEQLTGKNAEATLQFDVFPANRTDFTAKMGSKCLDPHKAPEALGVSAGMEIKLSPTDQSGGNTMSSISKLYGQAFEMKAIYQMKIHLRVEIPGREPMIFLCKLTTPISALTRAIEKRIGLHASCWRLCYDGQRLRLDRSVQDYEMEDHDILDLTSNLLGGGGGYPEKEMGIAVGGHIKQKIHADENDISHYNIQGVQRVYIHAVNAVLWKSITGLAAPISEINKATYRDYNLPWYEIYNEPEALATSGRGFAKVLSISDIDAQRSFKRRRVCGNDKEGDEATFDLRWKEGNSGRVVPIDLSADYVSPLQKRARMGA